MIENISVGYCSAVVEHADAEEDLARRQRHRDLAADLFNSISSRHESLRSQLQINLERLECLVGNCLVSAAVLVYGSALRGVYRAELLKCCREHLSAQQVGLSSGNLTCTKARSTVPVWSKH